MEIGITFDTFSILLLKWNFNETDCEIYILLLLIFQQMLIN